MTEMQAGDLLRDATARLKSAGVEGPRRDAVLLLSHASGIAADRLRIEPSTPVAPEAAVRFSEYVTRRADREPVSHILGRREFWSLEFEVSRDVLDPRPDSETLVQVVLDQVPDRAAPLRLVDFGTGSGCLLLALLHELPAAEGLGIDRSPAALAVAARNAGRLGLATRGRWREGDWGEGIAGAFDILISNPPYIETAAIGALAPEVARHEPRLALDGGSDGLAAYRALMSHLARLAAPGAIVALEIGQGQEEPVAGLLAESGFREICAKPDLAGIDRVILARNPR